MEPNTGCTLICGIFYNVKLKRLKIDWGFKKSNEQDIFFSFKSGRSSVA